MYIGEMAGHGGTVPDELVSKVNPVIACMKGTEAGAGRCVALLGEVGETGNWLRHLCAATHAVSRVSRMA
jgi:hypothetical protein